MNVLSLFAGIGGLDLGLERAGMTVVGQVEIDPFCQQVLAKHWPEVPRHDDVRSFEQWWPGAVRPPVDLVCGGFPCQPFSTAGLKAGVIDERWGWPWFADVVRLVRPSYVVVENVAALLRDREAFGWLLADLAAFGFDASWDCIPAAAVGAPHRRDRLFLVAYPAGGGLSDQPTGGSRRALSVGTVAGAGVRADGGDPAEGAQLAGRGPGVVAPVLADPNGIGRFGRAWFAGPAGWPEPANSGGWPTEPDVARVAHGVPRGVDRRRALGNAVVPQVAEHIGRLVTAHASSVRAA